MTKVKKEVAKEMLYSKLKRDLKREGLNEVEDTLRMLIKILVPFFSEYLIIKGGFWAILGKIVPSIQPRLIEAADLLDGKKD